MNAKKAKYYRRVARDLTIGKPARAYQGEPGASRHKRHHPVVLDKGCTRAEYQRLKAEYRALRSGGAL